MIRKPKMLYASPFWPMKSGISNYSSSLVQALKEHFDITLLTDNYKVEDERVKQFPAICYKQGAVYGGFDVVLYNFGNNPDYHGYMLDAIQDNPGYVILHDFSLYYLTVGVAQVQDQVFETVYKNEGIEGIQLVKDSLRAISDWDLLHHKNLADKLPLNQDVLQCAKGILAHSLYTQERVRNTGIKTDTCHINHIMTWMPGGNESPEEIKRMAEQNWGIPEDAFLLVAAGFIAPTKQNALTCQAVGLYNSRHEKKLYYLMAGEGDDADRYLGAYCKKTGFLSDEMYALALRRADVVMNLRYPTNGETSGTIIQGMQLGKPCVTTAIGWFDELPDSTVIKLSSTVTADELASVMEQWNTEQLRQLGEYAKEYMEREYAPDMIARQIKAFLSGEGDITPC